MKMFMLTCKSMQYIFHNVYFLTVFYCFAIDINKETISKTAIQLVLKENKMYA